MRIFQWVVEAQEEFAKDDDNNNLVFDTKEATNV